MPHRKHFVGMFLFLLLPFYTASTSAQSPDCSIHWDPPQQISYDSVFYSSPDLALSGDTIHTIWFGTDFFGTVLHDGVQYSRSEDGGHTFTPPLTLSSFDTALSPGLIACSNSSVYVAFEAATGTFTGTILLRSTDAGRSWIASDSISAILPDAYPILLEAIGADVYLHYANRMTRANGILRSTDHGATWQRRNSNMVHLSSLYLTPYELHGVALLDLNAKDVVYYRSGDYGLTWQFVEVLSNEFDFTSSQFPKITGNGKRDLYAAWNESRSIFLRHSVNNGVSWLPPAIISDVAGAVYPDIAANREFITVVWDNNIGGTSTLNLRPSNDHASTFCPIDTPSPDSGAGGPVIRISGNDVHLAWAVQSGISGTISYRHGRVIDNPNAADHPPRQYLLEQNFPNPFNATTHIRYEVPSASHVRILLYNILGEQVAKLVDGDRGPGRYELIYTDTKLASGLYFYRLTSGEFSEMKKLLLTK